MCMTMSIARSKEYARGEVHENRAECLFSLLKPYLRVFRGLSKYNLPGYVGFFQFLRNFRVAYPRPADKYLVPLVSRLSGINQPVISTRNAFSTPRPTPLACV